VTEPDRFADWDAAYVLGALTPQQRHEYEDHLAFCADCRSAVGELAGMPGLLSHLPPTEALALVEDDRLGEPGADLSMPSSIAGLRPPTRNRRGMIIVTLAVVLALVAGGVIGYVLRGSWAPPDFLPGSSPSAVRVAFEPVGTDRMIAVADLERDGTGTTIRIDCQYAARAGGGGHSKAYSYDLYVLDKRGERAESATWSAEPGSMAQPRLRSELPISQIGGLEIVGESGDVLVRAML
jgi:hypothetical protein